MQHCSWSILHNNVSYVLQNVEELERLLEQALSEVSSLMVTLLQKEVSSDNLESVRLATSLSCIELLVT